MAPFRLQNYLRAYRRKAGLTQREVAFLAGIKNSAQVSRYEKCRRVPPLRIAFALQAIFKVSLCELFAGISDAVGHETSARIHDFKEKLGATAFADKQQRFVTRKRCWLSETHKQEGETSQK
jgi:transcriptional regulator with XRE-family HTH domain